MAPKKAVSAYFLFCNEHRETARARYLAQAETEKVNVAAIAKLLGQEWRSLTDEQRKEYQAKAAEKSADNAAAAAAEREAEPVEGIEGCGGQGQEEDKDGKLDVLYPYGFPLSLVKRIVTMDEDVRSISSDALKATSKAAELVLQSLAAKAFQAALSNKRKTVKFSDILQAVSKDKRWSAAGLKDLLQHDEMFEEARTGHGPVKTKQVEQDPKAQHITAFFKA